MLSTQLAGVYPIFTQYLRTKGVDYLPLATFCGNHFNIVFHDVAGVFFLRDYDHIAELVYLGGCKALGLINKLLTSPLWRVLERKMSILDMKRCTLPCEMMFKSFYILWNVFWWITFQVLPGGVHDKPNEEKRCQTQSVPKTNKHCQ